MTDAAPAAVHWCRDPARGLEVARLFAAHAAPSYISHAELQGGRATAPGRWAEDVETRVAREAAAAIATDPDAPEGVRLALLTEGGALAGFAFVSFACEAAVPFATLEDMLLAPDRRGRGAGRLLLDWVAAECRARGCRRLFLESGLGNERAHRFFEGQGFAPTSVVMMREV